MKKRIFLIVSSIIAVLVVASLVVLTVISKPKKKGDTTVPGSDGSNSNIEKPSDSFGEDDPDDKYNKYYSYIVGDKVDCEDFINNYDQIGENFPFITKNEDGTFTASQVGEASATIVLTNMQITLHIHVYEKGDGSKENPYNIVRIEDFVKYFNQKNKGVYYKQQANIDLSSYNNGNWVPLGTLDYPFMSNYDGNGYKISNLNIVINESNIEKYISKNGSATTLQVGFFGVACGDKDSKISINKLILRNAKIDTTKIDTKAFKSSNEVFKSINVSSGIALVAGYVENVQINGVKVNGTIDASLGASEAFGAYDSPVAGLVGVAIDSSITATNAKVKITSTGVGFVDGEKTLSSCVAGLVGRITKSKIERCQVSPTIEVVDDNLAYIAGAVGVVGGEKTGSEINDVVVIGATFNSLLKYGKEINVAGFVSVLKADNSITNCHVYNSVATTSGSGEYVDSVVAGFVTKNMGTITNSTVESISLSEDICKITNTTVEGVELSANIATGFAMFNKGTIVYDKDFDREHIANVKINGIYQASGFVYNNSGDIKSDKKADMYAEIYCARINKLNDEKILSNSVNSDCYMASGFCITASGKGSIKNINVLANMYDTINASGLIGFVNGEATIENCSVSSTIRTLPEVSGKNYSAKSYIASGLIGIINKTGKVNLKDTSIAITVNNPKTAVEGEKYSLGVYGTLVALNYGEKQSFKIAGKISVSSVKLLLDVATNIASVKVCKIGAVAGVASQNQFVSVNGGKVSMKTTGKVVIAGIETKLKDLKLMND